jgi:hypothetical protein
LAVLAICGGFGFYWFVSSQVTKYTSETPVELPMVDYTPAQIEALESRLDTFKTTVESGESPTEDLVLTAEEINALINQQEELKGKVFVKISDGQVTGDVSFPTDAIPGGRGRYFNGSVSLDVSMENGVLIVTLADAEVNGEPVPEKIIEGMASENLAKDLYKDPENAKLMRRVEAVVIEDNKIILKMRREEPTGQDAAATAAGSQADEAAVSTDADSSPSAPNDAAESSPAADTTEQSDSPAETAETDQ